MKTTEPRLNWRLATTCAVVLTCIFAFQSWLGSGAYVPVPNFLVALQRQGVIWGTWLLLTPLVTAAARRYPIIDAPRGRWLVRQLLLATGFSLVHSILVSVIRHALGIAMVDSVIEGALNLFFANPGRNYLAYGFIAASYHMVAYHTAVRERDLRAVRLEVDLAEAKLAGLEARLRPHFLFNTLNTIAALIREDPAGAEAMVGQLSDLLRASLKADPTREIRLDEEMQLAEQYLAIQQVRFQDRLQVSLDASESARRAFVPQLILQPLVENAVRHGIAPRESGGSVWVRAEQPNGRLRITVEDDGVGVTDAPSPTAGTGLGLDSVRSRLAHLYGAEQSVVVLPRGSGGTRVVLEMPYHVAPHAD
jgi:two-component system, LytTR family, sensor kinase